MTIDIDKAMPYFATIGSSALFIIALWRFNYSLKRAKKEKDDSLIADALEKQAMNQEVSTLKDSNQKLWIEVRALQNDNQAFKLSIQEIKNLLNSLGGGFDEIKLFLKENIKEIHVRIDDHLKSHIEGAKHNGNQG